MGADTLPFDRYMVAVRGALRDGSYSCREIGEGKILLNFLFQIPKKITVKEIQNRDVQPVTDFLDGGDGGALIAAADDIVQCGLGDATQGAKPVDGDLPLSTKLEDSIFNCNANDHSVRASCCWFRQW